MTLCRRTRKLGYKSKHLKVSVTYFGPGIWKLFKAPFCGYWSIICQKVSFFIFDCPKKSMITLFHYLQLVLADGDIMLRTIERNVLTLFRGH